ncbi:MAG TPA: hypothetical protein VFV99_13735 [Kofleriaceae bacterium]|nr:hypothetical protein [Kofleriaceae bacterium]
MRVGIACVVVCVAGCGRIAFDTRDDGGGGSGTTDVGASDVGIPPGSYTRTISITAGARDVPAGYSISLALDHAMLVATGKSFTSGQDLGVLRGGLDIDRVLDAGAQWNSPTTRIWFRTASVIPANTTNTEHVLVYGRDATTPVADPNQVFLVAEDFENGLGGWQVGAGSWSIVPAAAHSGTGGVVMTGPLAGANRWIECVGLNAADIALESYWHVTGAAGNDLGMGVRSAAQSSPRHYLINLEQANGLVLAKDTASGFMTLSPYVTPPTANTWTRVAIMIAGQNARVLVNETQVIPAAGSTDVGSELATGSVSLYAYQLGNGQSWYVDDLTVRRYVDPEPTTTLGPEQQN